MRITHGPDCKQPTISPFLRILLELIEDHTSGFCQALIHLSPPDKPPSS
jgi:hypothetical protein